MKNPGAGAENIQQSHVSGEDEVSQESVKSAQKFLRDLTRSMHKVVMDEEQLLQQIDLFLPDEFKNVSIIKSGFGRFLNKFTAYPGLHDTLSTIPAYNIWFERRNGEWTLYYNVVRVDSLNPPL